MYISVVCLSALLFSATFKKEVEFLCRHILTDPIRIVIGELGEVITAAICLLKPNYKTNLVP